MIRYLFVEDFCKHTGATKVEVINSYISACSNLSNYLSSMYRESVIIEPVLKYLERGTVVGARYYHNGQLIKEYFHYDICKEYMIEEIYKFRNKEVNK